MVLLRLMRSGWQLILVLLTSKYMSLFGNDVRRGVVKIIDQRINETQKRFEAGAKTLAENVFADIEKLHQKHKTDKESLLQECIDAVLKI